MSPADVVALTGWRAPDGQMRDERGVLWVPSDLDDWRAGGAGAPIPSRDDPATLGCLLALVREAWPAEWPAHAVRGDDGTWRVWLGERVSANVTHHRCIGEGQTEWDGLAAALVAAPGRAP